MTDPLTDLKTDWLAAAALVHHHPGRTIAELVDLARPRDPRQAEHLRHRLIAGLPTAAAHGALRTGSPRPSPADAHPAVTWWPAEPAVA